MTAGSWSCRTDRYVHKPAHACVGAQRSIGDKDKYAATASTTASSQLCLFPSYLSSKLASTLSIIAFVEVGSALRTLHTPQA